jgi:hypothetical protein
VSSDNFKNYGHQIHKHTFRFWTLILGTKFPQSFFNFTRNFRLIALFDFHPSH